VFWSLLHRMILWELVKVFSLALVGITGILLLAGIIAEMSQQGLSPAQILTVIPLLVPSTLPYTIPATTLFATCIVYGRLAADNEILAIKASGVNILKVVWPAVLLGLVMSGITMGLYYRIIPYTHKLMRNMAIADGQAFLYGMLKRDRQINHARLTYAMWVRQVQGEKLIDALFKRRDTTGRFDLVAWAPEADLQVDTPRRQLLVHMRHGWIYRPGGYTGYFEDRQWEVPLPPSYGMEKAQPRPRDRTWQEILQRRQELLDALDQIEVDISLILSQKFLGLPPSELPKHLANLYELRYFTRVEIRSLNTELQMRPALALGCLCFVLVGCPVGIWFSRSDYLSAFITCFLPIVFLYYPLMLCGTNVTKDGRFPPELTVWAADALMGLVGLLLFRRLMRN
jgi:lipopolysaccharide export system permease protein